jgi:hypothetical protein
MSSSSPANVVLRLSKTAQDGAKHEQKVQIKLAEVQVVEAPVSGRPISLKRDPGLAPAYDVGTLTAAEKLKSILVNVLPMGLVVFAVIGLILLGWAMDGPHPPRRPLLACWRC